MDRNLDCLPDGLLISKPERVVELPMENPERSSVKFTSTDIVAREDETSTELGDMVMAAICGGWVSGFASTTVSVVGNPAAANAAVVKKFRLFTRSASWMLATV